MTVLIDYKHDGTSITGEYYANCYDIKSVRTKDGKDLLEDSFMR